MACSACPMGTICGSRPRPLQQIALSQGVEYVAAGATSTLPTGTFSVNPARPCDPLRVGKYNPSKGGTACMIVHGQMRQRSGSSSCSACLAVNGRAQA